MCKFNVWECLLNRCGQIQLEILNRKFGDMYLLKVIGVCTYYKSYVKILNTLTDLGRLPYNDERIKRLFVFFQRKRKRDQQSYYI